MSMKSLKKHPFIEYTGAYDSQFTPILLLHGWALNRHVWRAFIEHYRFKYRVMAMDLPGHGASHDVRLDKYDLDSVCDSIASAVQEPVIMLGWSLGAIIAQALTVRYPQLVEKLILVAGTAQFLKSDSWPHGTDQATFMQFADNVRREYRSSIERFLAIQTLGSKQALSQIKQLKKIMFTEPDPSTEALSGGLQILQSCQLQKQIADIGCECLFISGKSDRLIDPRASQASANLIPAANHIQIAGAGHAPFISHPAEFYSALEAML